MSASLRASQDTLAPIPFSILDSIFPILPKPNTNTLLPCIVESVSCIAIWIAPSAVEIVFSTVNSSLVIKSIISIFLPSTNFKTSSLILPAINFFPSSFANNSSIDILTLLNGVFISILLLDNGIGPITISLVDIASTIVLHCITFLYWFKLSASSNA